MHGRLIEELGYHCRDYFLKQWDKFKDKPWASSPHSTHVRGMGTYEDGVEKCRIQVTLATGIPEEPAARSTSATATGNNHPRRLRRPRG